MGIWKALRDISYFLHIFTHFFTLQVSTCKLGPAGQGVNISKLFSLGRGPEINLPLTFFGPNYFDPKHSRFFIKGISSAILIEKWASKGFMSQPTCVQLCMCKVVFYTIFHVIFWIGAIYYKIVFWYLASANLEKKKLAQNSWNLDLLCKNDR